MRTFAVAACVFALATFGTAPSAHSQEVKPAGRESITIRGILSASFYGQNANFGPGNGGRTGYVAQELEGWFHGADMRGTRLALVFAGPNVSGSWNLGGVLEADFLGAAAAGGAFGDEQPMPRLRLAYADVSNGRTTFRFGQDWSPTAGNLPMSTSHVAYVLGWGTGFIGWRFPGISVTRDLSPVGASTTVQLQIAAMKNSWSDKTNPDSADTGEAGLPQLEAKLTLRGKHSRGTWNLFAVAHADQKEADRNSVRAKGALSRPDSSISGTAGEVGGALTAGSLTLHGAAWVGRGMGHQFAQIIQFGDIGGWGGWGQAGYALNPHWSLWGFAGTDNPDDGDVRATTPAAGVGRLKTLTIVPMLRYQTGPYQLGVEWLRNTTTYSTSATASADRKGNQVVVGMRYEF